jgi:molecular chaperone DnaK
LVGVVGLPESPWLHDTIADMSSPVLGIDLGTTNSVVAVALDGKVQVLSSPEGERLYPSVVSFHPGGDVLTGYPARERRLVDASNTVYSIKRLIGRPFGSEEVRRASERLPFSFAEGPTGGALVVARGETYTLPEISAFVLRGVRSLAEQNLGMECRRAVITVPANFNELQRSATKAAGRVAGLDVLRILNEPTAAALAYGCGTGGGRERIAVYDLGGGTFDVTILELAGDVFEVLATAGDTFLGGDDMDNLVAERMVQSFLQRSRYDARRDTQAFERLRAAAEWAKCQLSANDDVELTVEELAYGDGGAALDLQFEMGRSELEQLARPLVQRTFDVCREAMRLAGLHPSQLDQVILVGGSTRMPLVRHMVAEYFEREPLSTIDPDLVVAQGAAIQGAMLAGQAESQRDTTPRTAIGRVALKRIGTPSIQEFDQRVPAGPAFQPKRPPALSPAPALRPGRPSLPPPLPKATAKRASFSDDLDVPELSLADMSQIEELPVLSHLVVPAAAVEAPPVQPSPTQTLPEPAGETIALPTGKAPLLLDVTPQSLRIETVAGLTEVVIERNSAIPVEHSRMFATSQDFQASVRARVCQGDGRKLADNQELGLVELTGIEPAARGKNPIEVTFVLDADGTLQVRAKDVRSGSMQAIRINLVGGIGEDEIARMTARQQGLVG